MAWNASNQASFEARLFGMARALQNVRDELDRLADLYVQESVASDPAFIGDQVTTAEMTAMISMLNELRDFFENGVVAQANRVDVLTPFLSDAPA